MNSVKQNEDALASNAIKPKSKLLFVLIPVLIVAVIAGIFIFKNMGKDATIVPTVSSGSNASGVDYNSAEFALDATETFDLDKLKSYGLPFMVDFGADSCIPCKEMAPILKELNADLRGKVIVKFVDVWKNATAAQSLPLSVIPTQFFFNADGTPYVPKDAQAGAAQGFKMYSTKDTGEHTYTTHEGGMTKEAILAVLKEMGMK